MVTELLDDQGQRAHRLLGDELGLLSRETGEQVVEGCEAGIDEDGMLGARGDAEGFEEQGDAVVGDVVLLDAGLDGVDLVDLGVGRGIGSEQGEQAVDLGLGDSVRHVLQEEDASRVASKLPVGWRELSVGKLWCGRRAAKETRRREKSC